MTENNEIRIDREHSHEKHEGHHREHESHKEHERKEQFKLGNTEILVIIIGVLLLGIVLYNTSRISSVQGNSGTSSSILPSVSASEIIPKGVPKIYGKELGISFDDISASNPQKADATISVLGNLDNAITLAGDDLQRYIDIGTQISCEYCCGAQSIIFSNGQAACGCAHSYAMRGLAKYLITKHGSEYTNDEILSEMGKWKVLFFPGIHEQKAQALKAQGIDHKNYINLASNKYRGIEKGQSSGGGDMVGGC